MPTLGSGTCLRLQQVLNQELVVVVHFLLGSLRAHSKHGGVCLCFGGGGMVGLRLGAGASGVGVTLRGGEEGGGEN